MPKTKKLIKKAPRHIKKTTKVSTSSLRNKILLFLGLIVALWLGKNLLFKPSDVYLVSEANSFQQSLSLDGATSIIASDSATLNPNITKGFAFEAWIKPDSTEFPHQVIFNKTSNNQNSFSLFVQSEYIASDNKYYMNYTMNLAESNCVTTRSLFNQRTYSGSQKDQVTKWHHVAGVVHPGGKLDLFVDGQASTQNTNSTTSVCSANTSPLQIGFSQPTAGGYFKGQIDEVRLTYGEPYPLSFTPSMVPFTVTEQTALLYHFNNNLLDSSPNHHDAILTGNTVYVQSTVPTPIPTIKPSPSPIPSGCYYQQVKCVKAPCNPILRCAPSPSPRVIRTPPPTPTPTPTHCRKLMGKVVCWRNPR